MRAPRVSVIVPAYNTQLHVRKCLESILGQALFDIEIICVDDGSTDGTLNILREYADRDERLTVLRQGNKGGGAARNTGLDAARGEYLMFVDSDDWMEFDTLRLAVEESDRHQADVCICSAYSYHDPTGERFLTDWVFRCEDIPKKLVFNYADMPEKIFNTFGNVPWNKLFRRSFVESHGLRFQEIFRTNDMYFVCRALVLARRMIAIDKPLVNYRIGTSANCQATNDREPLGFYKAFAAMKRFLEAEGVYSTLERGFLNHALDALIYNLSTLRTKESFEIVANVFKKEMENFFAFSDHPKSFFWNEFQYELYRALRDSPEGEELVFWGVALREQRDAVSGMLQGERSAFERERTNFERERADLRRELAGLREELASIRNSTSFKLGRILTAPARKAKDSLRTEK